MILHHLINIFIVSPAHVHVPQSTVGGINAILGIETGVIEIRILFEELSINDFVGIGTSHREGVSNYSPLRLTEEA
jgi:hypothetical protein